MKKLGAVLAGLMIISLMLTACGATPTPQVVQQTVTVKETVVVPQTVKETVIVAGTPQVVEKVITATPAPTSVPATPSATAKTFTVSWVSTDVSTLDPHVCGSSDCQTFVRNIYESLVQYKYGTTDIEAGLAESWDVSDDGLNWTFTLRKGLTFSDGSPVTTADVIYSCERLSGMQKGPSQYLGGVYAGATAVDDRTVTIKLSKTIGPFLAMVPRIFIVNSKVVKSHATTDDPWAEKWMYDHDAGSGPYTLEEWEHGVKMSVVKNKNYWDTSRTIDVERFRVLYIAERATDQLMLERGEIDALGFPVVDLIPTYKANPDLVVGLHDSFKGMNIMMNTNVPPLNDVRVRKAISLAFDYQAIIDGVFAGYAVQAQGPLSRNTPFHDDTLPIYKQDIEQAKSLLAEAGHTGGGLNVEVVVITGYTPWIGAAQVLQQSLAQIGITVKITEMPWTQMAARGQNRDDPLMMYLWNEFPAYPDPDATLYQDYHTSQQVVGWNLSFYGNAETDALLDKGRFSTDPAVRGAAYKELQQRLVSECVAIWMVNEQVLSVHRSWVGNYKYDPTWHETFRPDMLTLQGKP